MNSVFRTLTLAATAVVLSLGTALAADVNQTAGMVQSVVGSDSVPMVNDANRDAVAAGIADRWTAEAAARGYVVADWREELVANLLRLDNNRLAEARQAESYERLIEITTGKNPGPRHGGTAAMDTGMDLLTNYDDLVFTGITPCRILDTRLGTGTFAGPRAAGSTTTISTRVTSQIAAQGGNTAGCPMPSVDAGAIAYTITIVDYSGNGYVTVFPATATVPNASTINFNPGTAPTPLANSSVVQQCVGCGDDISIYVAGSTTNVIVDAIGYYDPPPPTTCTATRSSSLALDGTCQNLTSCSLQNTSSRTRTVICTAIAGSSISHTVGFHDEISLSVATTNSSCATYTTVGSGFIDINDAVPTGCCWNQTATAQAVYTISKGASQTYYFNVKRFNGFSSNIAQAALSCTMVD